MRLVALSDVFDATYGSSLELNRLELSKAGGIPFVSRTNANNGVSAWVMEVEGVNPNPPHTLSVAASGTVLATFYQSQPYYSGYHLFCLKPKIELSKIEMLSYAKYISVNAYRYSYGRQANRTIHDIRIPHPDEVKKRHGRLTMPSPPSSLPCSSRSLSLNNRKWGKFILTDLFEITGTKSIRKTQIKEHEKGLYPYITASSQDNGTEGFYNYYTEKGHVLTIDSATVGSCFYQKKDFSSSGDVKKLIPRFEMSIFTAMFVVTLLNLEKYRYGYGRKFAQKRIKQTVCKLPIDVDGKPDWQFMEDYIKCLPCSKALSVDEDF